MDVSWDDSRRAALSRWSFFLGSILFVGVYLYFLLLHSDRYGINGLWFLQKAPRSSREFIDFIVSSFFISILCLGALAMGLRNLFLSGQKMHCDGVDLVYSKIPWLSFGNRWVTRSFAVFEIEDMKYRLIKNERGEICFWINGRKTRIFYGIQATEAAKILKGLKSLGVGVAQDRDVLYLAVEEQRERRARL